MAGLGQHVPPAVGQQRLRVLLVLQSGGQSIPTECIVMCECEWVGVGEVRGKVRGGKGGEKEKKRKGDGEKEGGEEDKGEKKWGLEGERGERGGERGEGRGTRRGRGGGIRGEGGEEEGKEGRGGRGGTRKERTGSGCITLGMVRLRGSAYATWYHTAPERDGFY